MFAAVVLAALPAADPFTPEDVYRLDAPTAAVASPDGKRAVYVRAWVDPRRRERFSLWSLDGPAPRAVEPGEPDARRPVFAPDGRSVVVASTRPRPAGYPPLPPLPPASDPAADLWVVPLDGGPAAPLAGPDRPYGRVFHDGFYGGWAFAPDGRSLAFVAEAAPAAAPAADGVTVARDDQGEGYTGYGPAQLFVARLDATPARVERLTDDDVWYGDPRWSPDGKRVYAHANKTADRESVRYSVNKDFDVYAVDVATRAQERLTSGPGPEVYPRPSPDGTRVACLSVPRKGSHNDAANFLVVTLGAGGPRARVVYDHHAPAAGPPPHPPTHPASADPRWGWDGDALTYTAPAGVENVPTRVDVATGRGGRFAPRDPPTPRANPLLAGRALGEQRVFRWENEGRALEGVLTVPPAGRPPYKLVLYPHGGPHSRTALGFDAVVQAFAGAGYAVFQPNYRGSAGYGQAFLDADRADFGGGDTRDILTGLDALVRDGVADRGRQFVYGTSYGGYTTCWLVGHTRQFRAAVAVNAVTDLAMMWGLSDIPSWTEWEFGGRPWEVPALMRKHSPITYAAAVTTPTLVLHARDDRRCPLPMGVAYHRALRAAGAAAELVVYDGEGHGIRRPDHRVDVLTRALAWFAKHGG